jgi:hypothetical protein
MLTSNIGTPDRILRILIGAALVLWFFMGSTTGVWAWAALVVGIVLIATAAINFCPIYAILGWSTKR